jgi:hypothetical protein
MVKIVIVAILVHPASRSVLRITHAPSLAHGRCVLKIAYQVLQLNKVIIFRLVMTIQRKSKMKFLILCSMLLIISFNQFNKINWCNDVSLQDLSCIQTINKKKDLKFNFKNRENNIINVKGSYTKEIHITNNVLWYIEDNEKDGVSNAVNYIHFMNDTVYKFRFADEFSPRNEQLLEYTIYSKKQFNKYNGVININDTIDLIDQIKSNNIFKKIHVQEQVFKNETFEFNIYKLSPFL